MKFGLFDHTGGDRSRAGLVAVIEETDDGWEHAVNRRLRGTPYRWLSERVVPHVTETPVAAKAPCSECGRP